MEKDEKKKMDEKDLPVIKEESTRKSKKKDKGKFGVFSVIKILFFVAMLVISVLFAYSVLKTNMIPSKYITMLMVALIVINGLVGILELVKKKWLNVIGFILVILICSVFCVGMKYLNSTLNVIENIITQNEERTSYYILTSKGLISDISQLEGKKIGVIDLERELLEEQINEKVTNVEIKSFENVGDMIYALQLNDVDAIVLSDALYLYACEEVEGFLDSVEKLGEVEIVGKPTVVTSTIDVRNSFLIYISGIDTRDTSSLSPVGLSDVNIVVAVNPDTHKVLMVHIPRDYYVQLHGKTGLKDKLTHAGLYGIGMSMSTVSDIFNINIDTYVKVNFKTVTTLVDDIDGIDVYSDTAFGEFKQGMNHMNGAQALAFARERHVYASGDRHRGQNQEAVISAIIKKISSNSKYLLQYDKILADCQQYFATNFEMQAVQDLIKNQLDSGAAWSVESYNVNGSNSMNYTMSFPSQYSYVMIPNQDTVATAKNKIYAVMSEK